jgi:hypothetical protein
MLRAAHPDQSDYFAMFMSTGDNALIVGATHESSSATGMDGDQMDNSATGAGAVYVFR